MNSECLRCGAERETLIHAIKDCPKARETLVCGGLDDRLDFITLIWNSWNNKNNFMFQGKEESAITSWNKARALSNDFRIYNLREKPMFPSQPSIRGWKKPTRGFVKINVDAAFVEERMGLGVIVRDEDGFVLGGYGSTKDSVVNSDWAKIMAIEEGVILAKKMNLKKVHFESDNANIVNKINRKRRDITFIG
ncbi:reverse transcriptase [Gossypium australe]|uniref:Reverse transcriptase n=1 Tax=Gossypium australe TaxID=47621 RepID=A0A5B6X318_9ROSI|nr:reverse transcriptase [Gossypium australe]